MGKKLDFLEILEWSVYFEPILLLPKVYPAIAFSKLCKFLVYWRLNRFFTYPLTFLQGDRSNTMIRFPNFDQFPTSILNELRVPNWESVFEFRTPRASIIYISDTNKYSCMKCLNIEKHELISYIFQLQKKASEILVAPRISECFGLPWSALVCYSLHWSAIVCLGLP